VIPRANSDLHNLLAATDFGVQHVPPGNRS
jgi:hypothetical protein